MSLKPLRQAYVSRAKAAADETLIGARQQAASVIAAAHDEAERILDAVRKEGQDLADAQSSHERASAARRARTVLLSAQREAYQQFQRQALRRALALREKPEYSALLDHLQALARTQLGDRAEIDVDPQTVGGVRAANGRRLVDYTLPTLVERSISRLGEEVESLWQ